MEKLKRTNKQFCIKNLTEDFIRKACSIGGRHTSPLSANFDRFSIKEKFINQSTSGDSCISPYDGFRYGYAKYLNSIEIKLEGFDTTTIIWQNGKIQGYYDSDNFQYAADPIGWVNLLLEFEFLKID